MVISCNSMQIQPEVFHFSCKYSAKALGVIGCINLPEFVHSAVHMDFKQVKFMHLFYIVLQFISYFLNTVNSYQFKYIISVYAFMV
jgi:hypothetical protein